MAILSSLARSRSSLQPTLARPPLVGARRAPQEAVTTWVSRSHRPSRLRFTSPTRAPHIRPSGLLEGRAVAALLRSWRCYFAQPRVHSLAVCLSVCPSSFVRVSIVCARAATLSLFPCTEFTKFKFVRPAFAFGVQFTSPLHSFTQWPQLGNAGLLRTLQLHVAATSRARHVRCGTPWDGLG